MTKHVDFQWRVAVSAELLAGAVMDRWSEEENDMEQVGWDWRRAGHVTTCSPLIGQGEYNNNNYGAGNNNGAVVTLKAGAV